jgi:hypothetical protein
MPRVFVVQESPGKNILQAEDYGQVVILLPEDRQVAFSPGPIIRELRSLLADFCDEDYLLLIGDPVSIGIVCACACEFNQGKMKLLKWDKQTNKYFPIQVNLYPKKDDALVY